MATLKQLNLINGLALLLICSSTSAATNINDTLQISMPNVVSMQKPLQDLKLAYDEGYGDNQRIRSYGYCSRNVFEPCRRSGGSYRYCNRQHHMCTYGNLYHCVPGTTC